MVSRKVIREKVPRGKLAGREGVDVEVGEGGESLSGEAVEGEVPGAAVDVAGKALKG